MILIKIYFLQIREALESDNEDSNFSGSGNYGEDDEDDNLNVNKGGKFNLFEDRTNKVKPNKDSKNSILHSSGDGTDQHIDNDDEDDDHIGPDDDEDDLYIEKSTNTDPISPPFTDNEDSQLHDFILFIYYLFIIYLFIIN